MALSEIDELFLQHCFNGNALAAEAQLVRGAFAELTNPDGETMLYLASEMGYFDLVRTLIKFGADISFVSQNHDGNSCLHAASINGRSDVAGLLIDCNAEVDGRNAEGRTALHLASLHQRKSLSLFLIARGADTLAMDNRGETPMDLLNRLPDSIEYNETEVVVSDRHLRQAFSDLGPDGSGRVHISKVRHEYPVLELFHPDLSDTQLAKVLRSTIDICAGRTSLESNDMASELITFHEFCLMMLKLAQD